MRTSCLNRNTILFLVLRSFLNVHFLTFYHRLMMICHCIVFFFFLSYDVQSQVLCLALVALAMNCVTVSDVISTLCCHSQQNV